MKRRILITGAAGKTASGVVEMCLQRGADVRALVRQSDGRSDRLEKLGADVIVGDMLSYEDMRKALSGVDSVYFCYPTSDRVLEATAIFGAAAAENDVRFVVNMSQIIAGANARSPTSRGHWLAERALDRSALNVTHLRPTFFSDQFTLNVRHTIVKESKIIRPYGEAYHAPIATIDLARVIAHILFDPLAHIGKSYVLTGIERLSFSEIAALFSELLGRNVHYIDIAPEEFKEDMTRRNFAPSLVEHHMKAALDYREGLFDQTNNLVEEITGRPPMTFREFINMHIEKFKEAA